MYAPRSISSRNLPFGAETRKIPVLFFLFLKNFIYNKQITEWCTKYAKTFTLISKNVVALKVVKIIIFCE